jgi:uncharacterized protein (DUF58 family)
MTRPGPLLVRAVAGLCLPALAIPALPALAWALLAALAALVAAAALEARRLLGARVAVDRPASAALSLGEEETLGFLVRTDAPRPARVALRQTWPDLVEPASSARNGICRPGEILRLELPVRGVRRGRAEVAPPHVAVTFLGLWERIVAAGAPMEIAVLPNLRSVGRLHARLNQFVLRGLGSRSAARIGKGREFDRLREYVQDDDFRDIAWKASARHRKLIVREYRLDRSQEIVVCLDRGHRMAARVAGLTRLDHAVNAALLLAYMCNRMEDRVAAVAFAAGAERSLPAGRGAAHLRQMTTFLTPLQPDYAHTDYPALAAALRGRLRHRTLVLILTALPEMEDHQPLQRAVAMLVPRHLPVIVAFADPDLRAAARMLPATREELCRSLVAREIWAARRAVVAELRRRGALVAEADPGDAGAEAVNAYLRVKRRQML